MSFNKNKQTNILQSYLHFILADIVLHDFQILVESFALIIADIIKAFWKVMPNKVFCSSPIISRQFWCNSLSVYFPENSWQGIWMIIKHFLEFWNVDLWRNVNLWSIKHNGLDFFYGQAGKCQNDFLETITFSKQCFHELLQKTHFMCREGNNIFFMPTNGSCIILRSTALRSDLTG